MSPLHEPMKTADFARFAVTPKTLFSEWPGRVAVLIETTDGKPTVTPMDFADAKAALAWCESNRAALVYLPPADLRGN
ncbi:MAG: hypothetical protein JWR69_2655 [Pedosphaera sp.]|nr:hypothetical protein [Pedosphaera sp.]